MASQGQEHASGFSIIVKERQGLSADQTGKRPDVTADKYRKASNSVSSRLSENVEPPRCERLLHVNTLGPGLAVDSHPEVFTIPVVDSAPRTQEQSGNASPLAATLGSASYSSVETDCINRTMLQAQRKDKKFKHRKHSLWYRLNRRHKHVGVEEVTVDHPFYQRLKAVSQGIHEIMTDTHCGEESGPLDELVQENYDAIVPLQLKLDTMGKDGKEQYCLFESYAPGVFATIRRAVQVTEVEYLTTMACRNTAFLEFISNSRSGMDFFLSEDMRYLVKTNKEKDVKFLLSMLEDYLQHFLSYPHSLLVKYLGCYSVKFVGKKKMYFLVMQNIFYPSDKIEDRFDVKGCTAGRYQEPDPPCSKAITVLKDQNFFQEMLELGTNREWFIAQITADAKFLKSINVMDYSLLIGRQKLLKSDKSIKFPSFVHQINRSYRTHRGSVMPEEGNPSLDLPGFVTANTARNSIQSTSARNSIAATTTARNSIASTTTARNSIASTTTTTTARLSTAATTTSTIPHAGTSDAATSIRSLLSTTLAATKPATPAGTSTRTIQTRIDAATSTRSLPPTTLAATKPCAAAAAGTSATEDDDHPYHNPQRPGLHFPLNLAYCTDVFETHRRRLLPHCPNSLHVIDGPEHRYYVGIVDFLTRWTWRQRTARLWKVVKYGCGEHSTMPPNYYSRRFIHFLTNRVS